MQWEWGNDRSAIICSRLAIIAVVVGCDWQYLGFNIKMYFMKLGINSFVAGATLFCAAVLPFSSCSKSDSPAPAVKNNWVRVYKDVMLGDQENKTLGHFLKTKNGSVVAVESAQGEQAYLSMMYYTEYAGNYVVLTFPGSAESASAYKETDVNRLFIQNPGGINQWEQSNLTTGEIHAAYRDGAYMTTGEFEAVAAAANWAEFDKQFSNFNGGQGDLSAGNFVAPENGMVYLVQLNNTVRALVRVKSVVPKSANGGSVKLDMIIEGGDDYSKSSEAVYVQPEKN